jgi:hypothetical protein
MANYKPKIDPLKAYKSTRRTEEEQNNWNNFWDNLDKSNGSKEETGAEEKGQDSKE